MKSKGVPPSLYTIGNVLNYAETSSRTTTLGFKRHRGHVRNTPKLKVVFHNTYFNTCT